MDFPGLLAALHRYHLFSGDWVFMVFMTMVFMAPRGTVSRMTGGNEGGKTEGYDFG